VELKEVVQELFLAIASKAAAGNPVEELDRGISAI
jgi:hypothetical protein